MAIVRSPQRAYAYRDESGNWQYAWTLAEAHSLAGERVPVKCVAAGTSADEVAAVCAGGGGAAWDEFASGPVPAEPSAPKPGKGRKAK